jgi:hypothetical protein
MAKRGGMYSSNKRKKELQRQKKQEEKKKKRQKNAGDPSQGPDETESMNSKPEPSEGTDQETD